MAGAPTPATFEEFSKVLVASFREVMEPAPPPMPQLVTIGETSDAELDHLLFCVDCLGKHGSRWGTHKKYHWIANPKRPEEPQRIEEEHDHPPVRKTYSYDAQAASEGLAKGTHGNQCLFCGTKLRAA